MQANSCNMLLSHGTVIIYCFDALINNYRTKLQQNSNAVFIVTPARGQTGRQAGRHYVLNLSIHSSIIVPKYIVNKIF